MGAARATLTREDSGGAGSLKSPGKFEEPGQVGWGRFFCQAASKGLQDPLTRKGGDALKD